MTASRVAGLVNEVLLEKGRVVYHAGDDADALYLVASGAVDVLDGENTIIRYGLGEIFGEVRGSVPDDQFARALFEV